jgi:hypothetical protein
MNRVTSAEADLMAPSQNGVTAAATAATISDGGGLRSMRRESI